MQRVCRPCWIHRGKVAPAVEIVDGSPWCSECFARLGKVEEMPKVTGAVVIAAIQKDLAAGMNVNQAAEKHSVAWATAARARHEMGKDDKATMPDRTGIRSARREPPPENDSRHSLSRDTRLALRPKRGRPAGSRTEAPASNGLATLSKAELIESLRTRRDALSAAIEALEA